MSVQEFNKNIIRELIETTDRGEFHVLRKYYDKDFIEHNSKSPLQEQGGSEGVMKIFKSLGAAMPNRKHLIEELVAEGDKVAARITFIGTFDHTLGVIKPTHLEYRVTSTAVYLLKEGKIMEKWTHVTVPETLGVSAGEFLKNLKHD